MLTRKRSQSEYSDFNKTSRECRAQWSMQGVFIFYAEIPSEEVKSAVNVIAFFFRFLKE